MRQLQDSPLQHLPHSLYEPSEYKMILERTVLSVQSVDSPLLVRQAQAEDIPVR